MGWIPFVLVFVAFFVTHMIPVRPHIRSRLVKVLGQQGFTLAYSTLSLAMLCALIWATGHAPFVPLWDVAIWQKYVTLAAMLVVCLLLAISVGRPNPFSFGGAKNDQFDPAHPGILRLTRHPLLIALALWAAVHLLPNGDLAHVILFGVFTGFALFGRKVIDQRMRRTQGESEWLDMLSVVNAAPLFYRPRSVAKLAARLAGGFAGYLALIGAHPVFLGVSPLP